MKKVLFGFALLTVLLLKPVLTFAEVDMVDIPLDYNGVDGTFIMGSIGSNALPEHQVTLTNPFSMSRSQITNVQYVEVLNYALGQEYLTGNYTSNQEVMNLEGEQRKLVTLNSNTDLDFDNISDLYYTVTSENSSETDNYEVRLKNALNNRIYDTLCQIYYDNSSSSFLVRGGYENRPVTYITWSGAAFYCNMLSEQAGLDLLYDLTDWRCDVYGKNGYRLATEAEYEYVATYNDNRQYPWGNDFPIVGTHANYNDYIEHSVDIDSYPTGYSQLGMFDMVGNVLDFVQDPFPAPYDSLPIVNPVSSLEPSDRYMTRSAYWGVDDWALQAATRSGWTVNFFGSDHTSFRAVNIVSGTDIENNYELSIMNYELKQNYPNPFNPTTEINYELRIANYETVEIVVYNSLGQKVWSSGNLPFTIHHSPLLFDGSKFNSGIYYYSLVIDGKKMDTKSMVLIK